MEFGDVILPLGPFNRIIKDKEQYFNEVLTQFLSEETQAEVKPYYCDGKKETDDFKLKGLIVFKTKHGRSYATYEEGSRIKFVGKTQIQDWKEVSKESVEFNGHKVKMPYLKPIDSLIQE